MNEAIHEDDGEDDEELDENAPLVLNDSNVADDNTDTHLGSQDNTLLAFAYRDNSSDEVDLDLVLEIGDTIHYQHPVRLPAAIHLAIVNCFKHMTLHSLIAVFV